MEHKRTDLDSRKVDEDVKHNRAKLVNDAKRDRISMASDGLPEGEPLVDPVEQMMMKVLQMQQESAQKTAEALQQNTAVLIQGLAAIQQAASAPKEVKISRDQSGRITSAMATPQGTA